MSMRDKSLFLIVTYILFILSIIISSAVALTCCGYDPDPCTPPACTPGQGGDCRVCSGTCPSPKFMTCGSPSDMCACSEDCEKCTAECSSDSDCDQSKNESCKTVSISCCKGCTNKYDGPKCKAPVPEFSTITAIIGITIVLGGTVLMGIRRK